MAAKSYCFARCQSHIDTNIKIMFSLNRWEKIEMPDYNFISGTFAAYLSSKKYAISVT